MQNGPLRTDAETVTVERARAVHDVKSTPEKNLDRKAHFAIMAGHRKPRRKILQADLTPSNEDPLPS
jgi:hypothetical protein